jgi:electron transport complex protein RnfB
MLIAKIREDECIGCTKCITACPVDAIIGAHKFLHTVLNEECIGCRLCVAPCPMDCIDMIENPIQDNVDTKTLRATKAKHRYVARRQRLIQKQKPLLMDTKNNPEIKAKIQEEIKLALARVSAKKKPSSEK